MTSHVTSTEAPTGEEFEMVCDLIEIILAAMNPNDLKTLSLDGMQRIADFEEMRRARLS